MKIAEKNEWLAELLQNRRDLITEYWIEDIRSENIPGYQFITDEQLCIDLPQTVDSMIQAFQTGDTEGPRLHSTKVIQKRLSDGLLLPDLQMSLYALKTTVMRIVKEADIGLEKEFEALVSINMMYYSVALIAAVVYEQLRAEQHRRFITTYELGAALSETLDMNAILDISVRKAAEYINAESAAIFLAASENGKEEVKAYYNLDADILKSLPSIRETISYCTENESCINLPGNAYVVPDVRSHGCLDEWSELLASRRCLSIACIPLMSSERSLGTMMVLWPEIHQVAELPINYLLALTNHIVTAIQNAMLYEEARGKRELGTLLQASKLFASSLDTQDVLGKIAHMSIEAIKADLAVVLVKGHLRVNPDGLAYYTRGREARRALKQILTVVVPEWERGALGNLGISLTSGKPILFENKADFTGKLKPLAEFIGSGLAVPIRYKHALIGAFILASPEENILTEGNISLASGLADLAAIAIENARLYEYEKRISETLQKCFLPPCLPTIEGYEIAAYYRPAMAEAEIGGDFYNVFVATGGRTGIVIGDVSGKGLDAALPTIMSKYMIRAYGTVDMSPCTVLTHFNKAFRDNNSDDLFMTVLYGILDSAEHTFTYANAGHNPPLLYSADRKQVGQIISRGVCIGVCDTPECGDNTTGLRPGDAILLYTDGATDVKRTGSRLEIEGLEQLFLSAAHTPAEQIVNIVSNGILDYGHGKLPDDVALLVFKRIE